MPTVAKDGMRGLAVFISDIRNCKSKEAETKRINKVDYKTFHSTCSSVGTRKYQKQVQRRQDPRWLPQKEIRL